jgi:hypothetical protein
MKQFWISHERTASEPSHDNVRLQRPSNGVRLWEFINI